MGKNELSEKEKELKAKLTDLRDEMLAVKQKEDQDHEEKDSRKEQSKQGQLLRDQSALMVLQGMVQRIGGAKFALGDDGHVIAETTDGGVQIDVENLLPSKGKSTTKKGKNELVESLLNAAGHNLEYKKDIEIRKLELMIEESKTAREDRRMAHELAMKKLELQMEERRDEMRIRMMELEERLLHKNEK
jgi:hypothetical protein